jgi:hypothetical protein
MELKDGVAPFEIGRVHDHQAVEAARPQEGTIQHLGPVSGSQDNDTQVGLKPIQADEQLIECLFPLVIHITHAHAALPPHGVQFIDENDAGRMRFRLLE